MTNNRLDFCLFVFWQLNSQIKLFSVSVFTLSSQNKCSLIVRRGLMVHIFRKAAGTEHTSCNCYVMVLQIL